MFLDGKKCHTQKGESVQEKLRVQKLQNTIDYNLILVILILFLLAHFKTCSSVPYNSEYIKFSLFCSIPFVYREIQASRVTLSLKVLRIQVKCSYALCLCMKILKPQVAKTLKRHERTNLKLVDGKIWRVFIMTYIKFDFFIDKIIFMRQQPFH